MKISIKEEERKFLKETLQWARIGYEEKSAKYIRGEMSIPGYYENQYLPKIGLFQELQHKLNKKEKV